MSSSSNLPAMTSSFQKNAHSVFCLRQRSTQDSKGEKIFDFLRFAQCLTEDPEDALPGSDVWKQSPALVSMPDIVPV